MKLKPLLFHILFHLMPPLRDTYRYPFNIRHENITALWLMSPFRLVLKSDTV